MLKHLIFLILFINLVKGKGEVSILSTPPGAFVKGHQKITEFDLLQLLTASLGFSVDKGSSFTNFHISNPFQLASAVVRVSVDGVPSLGGSSGHVFPLKSNGYEDVTSSSLPSKIEERYPSQKSIIADINLSDGLNSMKNLEFLKESNEVEPRKAVFRYLKPTVKEDQEFIEEIHFLNTITQQIEDGAITDHFEPDYFAIKTSALHAVSDLHGENSSAAIEARQVLFDALARLNAALQKAYSNRVLFAIVTNDASHTRRIRQASGDPKETEENPMNRAKTYSSDYPVIFNIILWFGVIMVFTLLAISLAIGNMDPGRDSIIYRMTSTRMKKDN